MNCSTAVIRKNYLFFVLLVLLILASCSNIEKHYSNEKILAKVGDRVITLDEFIHRAEYTPRPKYCDGDNAYDKRIILYSSFPADYNRFQVKL